MPPSPPGCERANVVTMLVAEPSTTCMPDRLALEQALTLVAQMAWDAGTEHALANRRPRPAGGGTSAKAAD